jgi:hypothetical protein
MAWQNSDGLRVKLGTEEGTPAVGGEYVTTGARRAISIEIDLADLNTSTDTILHDTSMIPAGAFVEEVEIMTLVLATSAGGTATLTVGVYKTDRTVLDADGYIVTAAQTLMDAAGEVTSVIIGHGDVGTLVGEAISENGLISAIAGTEVFTAGRVRLTFYYSFL